MRPRVGGGGGKHRYPTGGVQGQSTGGSPWKAFSIIYEVDVRPLYALKYESILRSCCGSVHGLSIVTVPGLNPAERGSSALAQGTLSSLSSPSEMTLKLLPPPPPPWSLAYKQLAILVAR